MSNEVAVRDTDSWAPMLPAVGELAGRVANTEFIPVALRGKPAAVAACILAGRELGLGPMQSLAQIHIVEGRPAPSAELMRALVLAQGHALRFREMSNTRVVVEGRRRGEEEWTTVTWTLDDAKRAGLDGRQNWRKYPRRMLAARATAELARLVFADVVGGMPFSVEELEDDSGDDVAVNGTTSAVSRRTARRAAVPPPEPMSEVKPEAGVRAVGRQEAASAEQATVPEPGLPGEETPDGGTEDGDDRDRPVTRPQLAKMHAAFNELGIAKEERAERLRLAGAVVGREIGSSNDLTKAEASTLIDVLEQCLRQPQPRAALDELVAAAARAEQGTVVDGEIVEDDPWGQS